MSPINNVTDAEYVYLVTSVESAYNKLYDCEKCLSTYKDKTSTDKQKELKSCEIAGQFRFQISNIKYAKCPGNYSIPQVNYYLRMYFDYEKHGILGDAPVIMDSNYKLIQILGIIESVVELNRKKQRDKELSKSKRTRK